MQRIDFGGIDRPVNLWNHQFSEMHPCTIENEEIGYSCSNRNVFKTTSPADRHSSTTLLTMKQKPKNCHNERDENHSRAKTPEVDGLSRKQRSQE